MHPSDYSIDKTLSDVVSILEENPYAQIKLSNYKNPGFLYSKPSDIKQWIKNDNKDYQYKVESYSWVDDPKTYYSTIKSVQKYYEWFICSHNDQHWSNHIYACNTEFLKNTILPLLRFSCHSNPMLDIMYQGLEYTLIHIDELLGKDAMIDQMICNYKNRTVFSGGGNFYHNK
jgi:hypothetical protein